MAREEQKKEFHFDRKNYFRRFISQDDDNDDRSTVISRSRRHALEYFVDDLRRDRIKTIEHFLDEPTLQEVLRAIAQLLLNPDNRVCGDSAYILGSIIELERGLQQFIAAFSSNAVDIIRILSQMLTHTDSECILNAAGTLGTICGSKEGRELMVHHACVPEVIVNASILLSSPNDWIASNAALVLARITVEEKGCQSILTHTQHRDILNRLLAALDIKDTNRSTNIAFAIARLIEGEDGKKMVIDDCGLEKFFEVLLTMLEASDGKDIHKNACYTLSSFCTSQYGFELCIQSITIFRRILVAIERILSSNEHETIWFALMCLRTLAKYHGASDYLCASENLLELIRCIGKKWTDSRTIQDEARLLWFMIHRDLKPRQPNIDECRNTSANISWEPCRHNWDDTQVQYRIILNDTPITITTATHYCLADLKLNTNYNVRIQYITTQGESDRSDPAALHTHDQLPPPIINLHLARTTMTAVRLVWEIPDMINPTSMKGYQIYLNKEEYEMATECGITIGSLTASTDYQIDVCSVTNKGLGPRSSIRVKTASAGDSVPAPPTFTVIGRRELYIKWQPPEVIAGRLTRYDLFCNDRCIYSGTDQEYRASMLKSDTEYTIEVVAITNEGRFRSRPAKIRTLKNDSHNLHRHSLYESPSQHSPRVKRAETVQTKKVAPGTLERNTPKEAYLPNQNIQITTVRAVHFKTDPASPRRALPGLSKSSPPRISRNYHRRPRLDMATISPPRISAAVIIPTLNIDHPRDAHWPARMKSYRYPI